VPLIGGVNIPAAILNAGALALLVYWSVALFRLVRTHIQVPTLRHGLSLAGPRTHWPALTLVIPAHNEEVSVEALVRSLRAQDYPGLSVLLCLDRCTDQTAAIARRAAGDDQRIRVLEIAECPPDWAGKVNAIWQGVRSAPARGVDLLAFADADTVFEPGALRAAVALLDARRADLLSVLSTLTSRAWFERIVQPIACMEVIRQYPLLRANKPPGTRRRPFANGQFMLFRRAAYEAVGGHAAVKDELLEDLALARAMGQADLPTALVVGDGLLHCRMYESWPAFRAGWKRIYIECAKRKVRRLTQAAWIVRVFYAALPVVAAANLAISLAMQGSDCGPQWRPGLNLSTAALAAWGLTLLGALRISRAPLWTAPASIAGAWLTAEILAEAARDLSRGVPTVWGGREYVRTPR
jgi:chlorobactene glucosyltransferase